MTSFSDIFFKVSFPLVIEKVSSVLSWRWNWSYVYISAVYCRGVPDWNANFNSTKNHASAVVNYTCPNGTWFADRARVKLSKCLINGVWSPPIEECTGNTRNSILRQKLLFSRSISIGKVTRIPSKLISGTFNSWKTHFLIWTGKPFYQIWLGAN